MTLKQFKLLAVTLVLGAMSYVPTCIASRGSCRPRDSRWIFDLGHVVQINILPFVIQIGLVCVVLFGIYTFFVDEE